MHDDATPDEPHPLYLTSQHSRLRARRAIFRDAALTSVQKLILLAIMNRMELNCSARPSMREMSADTGLCRSSVIRAVSALESAGWLAVQRGHRDEDGAPEPNTYRVTPPKL